MQISKLAMILTLGILFFGHMEQQGGFGFTADDKVTSDLVELIRAFERGINTRDVDLAMSVWSSQATIQAGAAVRKDMYSWEEYKKRLVNWVKVVKDFEHFNFREVKIEGNEASLMCDARLMSYRRKTDRWKPRTVVNVYYEFLREEGKWYLLKRTY